MLSTDIFLSVSSKEFHNKKYKKYTLSLWYVSLSCPSYFHAIEQSATTSSSIKKNRFVYL